VDHDQLREQMGEFVEEEKEKVEDYYRDNVDVYKEH